MRKIVLTFIVGMILFLRVGNNIDIQAASVCPANQTDVGCGGSGGGKGCGNLYRGCLDTSANRLNCIRDTSCDSTTNSSQNQTSSTTTSSGGGSITCRNGKGIDTAIGCIPIDDQNALIGFFLRWGLGIGGGIAFLLILVAGFQIITSRGDPNRLKAGQELMTSAIAGILLLIFSLVILRIIGFDILGIKFFG